MPPSTTDRSRGHAKSRKTDEGSGRLHLWVEEVRGPCLEEMVVLFRQAEHDGFQIGDARAQTCVLGDQAGMVTIGVDEPDQGLSHESAFLFRTLPTDTGRLTASHLPSTPASPVQRERCALGTGWQEGQKYDERFMNATRRIGVLHRSHGSSPRP